MGRPKNMTLVARLSLSVPTARNIQLQRLAQAGGQSLADMVRRAIAAYIDWQPADHQIELPFDQSSNGFPS